MVDVNEEGRLNAQNTLNTDAMIKSFKDFDVDIVVLPEFAGDAKGDKPNQRMFALMEEEKIDSQYYDMDVSEETEGNTAPVTVVIKKYFEKYQSIDN